MVYRLTPSLIEAGKVYIAESPLYEITTKKQVYFCEQIATKQTCFKCDYLINGTMTPAITTNKQTMYKTFHTVCFLET